MHGSARIGLAHSNVEMALLMKSFLELTKERYSVREYLPKEIEEELAA